MGIYRFLLALSVVYFHFGGGGWAVGRMAIFAFYLISGYVIYRVLDRTYLRQNLLSRILAFYGNRLLRILPLFVLVSPYFGGNQIVCLCMVWNEGADR